MGRDVVSTDGTSECGGGKCSRVRGVFGSLAGWVGGELEVGGHGRSDDASV